MFWAGIAGTCYGSWWLYAHDNRAWIIALIFGSLLTRMIFEGFIIRYRTYTQIDEIRRSLAQIAGDPRHEPSALIAGQRIQSDST